jgi:hypothetical protein
MDSAIYYNNSCFLTSCEYNPDTTQPETKNCIKRLPIQRQRVKQNSRLLPQSSIDIMTQWYDRHYANPYPNYRELEMMSQAGGITINQVKQWFVNVRRRTQNIFRKKREIKQRSLDDIKNQSYQEFSSSMNNYEVSQKNVSYDYSAYHNNYKNYFNYSDYNYNISGTANFNNTGLASVNSSLSETTSDSDNSSADKSQLSFSYDASNTKSELSPCYLNYAPPTLHNYSNHYYNIDYNKIYLSNDNTSPIF